MDEYLNTLNLEIDKLENDIAAYCKEHGVGCIFDFVTLPFVTHLVREESDQLDVADFEDGDEPEELPQKPQIVFNIYFGCGTITFEAVDCYRVPEELLKKIASRFKKLSALKLEHVFCESFGNKAPTKCPGVWRRF